MVEILGEMDRIKAVRRIGFCYICGEPLERKRGVGWNVDHVPPIAYVSGRAAALPMRAHPACNHAWSARDERGAQFVSTMIGRYPSSPANIRIDVTRFPNPVTGESRFGVLDFGFEKDVRRIVRAFHAAVYNDYLPEPGIEVSLPFAAGHAPAGVPEADPFPVWHTDVVLHLLRSDHVKRLDRLLCGKNECEYICTWMLSKPGLWQCVFGLRVHTWGHMGEPAFGQRGCVGFYHRKGPPVGASEAPTIDLRIRIPNRLDPFVK
jgi:hypothetical protein